MKAEIPDKYGLLYKHDNPTDHRKKLSKKAEIIEVLKDNRWAFHDLLVITPTEYNSIASEIEKLFEVDIPSEEQNVRMREWFKIRTGLKSGLLSVHMKEIDKLLEAK